MRRIYAAVLHFDGDPTAVLPRARAVVRHGVSQPWGGWPATLSGADGTRTVDDHTYRWRTLEGAGTRLWELRIDEPSDDDPTMRLATHIQIGAATHSTYAAIDVAMRSDNPALSGPFVYENAAPGIVEHLVNQLPCRDGQRPVTTSATHIGPHDADTLGALIDDPDRQLPAIVFATDTTFDSHTAGQVAANLAGLAHITTVDRDLLPTVAAAAGIELTAGVAAHVFWAGMDRRRRPQWFRADQLAPSRHGAPAWPVVRTVFSVAAFRTEPPTLATQIEAEHTRRRITALEAATPTDDRELLAAWETDLVELERTQQHSADLEADNDRLRTDLAALLAAFDVTVTAATRPRTDHHDSTGDEPATLADAVQLAVTGADTLVFLPDAHRSAARWRYTRPAVILDALRTLDRLGQAWRDGTLDGSFLVAARAVGLPWKPAVSPTALNRYRDDYQRRWDGRNILLGPHLSWGNTADNAVRIYLHLDRDTRTIVVGHIGEHLRDTTNPHR